MSANENCPRCGQPADTVLWYGFVDVTNLKDLRWAFGCSKCQLISEKMEVNVKVVAQILEKLKEGLEGAR